MQQMELMDQQDHTPIKKRIKKKAKFHKINKTKEIEDLRNEYGEALDILRDVVGRMQEQEALQEDLSPMLKHRFGDKIGDLKPDKQINIREELNDSFGMNNSGNNRDKVDESRESRDDDNSDVGIIGGYGMRSSPELKMKNEVIKDEDVGEEFQGENKPRTLQDYHSWWRDQQPKDDKPLPQIELGGLGAVSPAKGSNGNRGTNVSHDQESNVSIHSDASGADVSFMAEKIAEMQKTIDEQAELQKKLVLTLTGDNEDAKKELLDSLNSKEEEMQALQMESGESPASSREQRRSSVRFFAEKAVDDESFQVGGQRRSSVKDRPPTPVKWAKINLDDSDDEDDDDDDDDDGDDANDIDAATPPVKKKSIIEEINESEKKRQVKMQENAAQSSERRKSSISFGNDTNKKPSPELVVPSFGFGGKSMFAIDTNFGDEEDAFAGTEEGVVGVGVEEDDEFQMLKKRSIKDRAPTPVKWAKVNLDDSDEDDEDGDEGEGDDGDAGESETTGLPKSFADNIDKIGIEFRIGDNNKVKENMIEGIISPAVEQEHEIPSVDGGNDAVGGAVEERVAEETVVETLDTAAEESIAIGGEAEEATKEVAGQIADKAVAEESAVAVDGADEVNVYRAEVGANDEAVDEVADGSAEMAVEEASEIVVEEAAERSLGLADIDAVEGGNQEVLKAESTEAASETLEKASVAPLLSDVSTSEMKTVEESVGKESIDESFAPASDTVQFGMNEIDKLAPAVDAPLLPDASREDAKRDHSAAGTPEKDAAIEDTNGEDAVGQDEHGEPVVGEDAPLEDAPVEDAPVEDAPVEDAPVEDAPLEDAPLEDAPLEDAPLEDAPVEDAPLEDAPLEDAPVEDAPLESAMDAPVEVTMDDPLKAARNLLEEEAAEKIVDKDNNNAEIGAADGRNIVAETEAVSISVAPVDKLPLDGAKTKDKGGGGDDDDDDVYDDDNYEVDDNEENIHQKIDLEESLEQSTANEIPALPLTTMTSPGNADEEEVVEEDDIVMTDRSEGYGGKIYLPDGTFTTTTDNAGRENEEAVEENITSPEKSKHEDVALTPGTQKKGKQDIEVDEEDEYSDEVS